MAKRSPDTAVSLESDMGVEDTLGDEEQTLPSQEAEIEAAEDDPQTTEYEEEEESAFGEWSQDTAEDLPFRVILYGPPGSGKTYYGGTFPKPLFIDLENGLRSVFKLGSVGRYPKDPEDRITNLDQVRTAWYEINKATKAGNFPYDTVVIDSLQELQVLVVNEQISKYKQVSRQMDDQLTWQDYGKVNRVFLSIIRNFLKLPYHIVMTSTQTKPEFEGDMVAPAFSGKGIWKDLSRIVEQIGYCTVRKNDEGRLQHMVSYLLSPQYEAKTRVDIDERWLPNDFSALLKYAISKP